MGKIFYGWWVLLSLFTLFMAVSISVSTLPLLNAELKTQFGWTHEEVSRAPSLFYFFVSLFAPVVGFLLDKYNPHKIIFVGVILFFISLMGYYLISDLWHLTFVYILFAMAITSTGQIPSVYILARWFEKYRGAVIGIYFVGSSFSGIIFPQLVGTLIRQYNWQVAVIGLGVICFFCLLIPLFLIKVSPQAIGLTPDGITQPVENKLEQISQLPSQKNLSQILSSFTFYLILFITGALCFCIFSLVQHLGYFFKDLQLDSSSATNILSLFFTCSIIGKIMFGFLSDYFGKKMIMTLAALNMCIGPFFLSWSQENILFLYPTIVVYGIGYSGTLTMIQLLVSEYYTGSSFGKILGIVTTVDTLSGSAGIYVLGWMRTSYGSYSMAFMLLFWLCLVSTFCVLLLQKPTKERV